MKSYENKALFLDRDGVINEDFGYVFKIEDFKFIDGIFEILKEAHEKYEFTALIHCFSQSVDMMEKYLKMGDYIALGGAVTFKNSKTPKEVAKKVDLERLLLETDCPYMTPVPYRGKRNEPKYVKFTCNYIADLRQIESSELEKITAANTKRFFGI